MAKKVEQKFGPADEKTALLAAMDMLRKHRTLLYSTMRGLHIRLTNGPVEGRRDTINAFGNMLKRCAGEWSVDRNGDELDEAYGNLHAYYEREHTKLQNQVSCPLEIEKVIVEIEVNDSDEWECQALRNGEFLKAQKLVVNFPHGD
ncbi:hypothetical protein G7Y89_g2629 [Cudoniella acicularis]|uniref:Uncharacterized protein n=1 Tax=Cudoniella acicularis TaxID=354080 RepID=A0A8H4RT10_9HELO|nr:hypothetical protein G7Y89_g2629 [Cudoniella acicularis]